MVRNRGCSGRDVPPAEFARQLLTSIGEVAAWAAADGWDLDDADHRARLSACLASMDGCLMTLRDGIAEAMAREAK